MLPHPSGNRVLICTDKHVYLVSLPNATRLEQYQTTSQQASPSSAPLQSSSAGPASSSTPDNQASKASAQPETEDEETKKNCQAWMKMADNFEQYGMDDKAKAYLQKIIDKYPNSSYAEIARRRIAAMK